eukprot:5491030-Pleurochrysis_carterae.AAC.1
MSRNATAGLHWCIPLYGFNRGVWILMLWTASSDAWLDVPAFNRRDGARPTTTIVQVLIRRISVILLKQRIVPFIAGESGDGMARLVHHFSFKYQDPTCPITERRHYKHSLDIGHNVTISQYQVLHGVAKTTTCSTTS